MLREPAGDSGWRDTVAVLRRNFARGVFERVTAIVERQSFKDFRKGIGFVADRKGTSRERATAGAAAVEWNVFEFLFAGALFNEARAVAMWAAFGWFNSRPATRKFGDRRSGARVQRHMIKRIPRGVENAKRTRRDRVVDSQSEETLLEDKSE